MTSLRRIESVTEFDHGGHTVALFETNWLLTAGGGRGAVGLSYRSPGFVDVDGQHPIRIHDHLMLIRLSAFIIVLLAVVIGKKET
ncbi:MAG: hypothetical protein ACRDWH_06600 [Acidimicrobiia bacterium]